MQSFSQRNKLVEVVQGIYVVHFFSPFASLRGGFSWSATCTDTVVVAACFAKVKCHSFLT